MVFPIQFHSLIHAYIDCLSWKNSVNFLPLLCLYRHMFYMFCIKEKSWRYQGSEQYQLKSLSISPKPGFPGCQWFTLNFHSFLSFLVLCKNLVSQNISFFSVTLHYICQPSLSYLKTCKGKFWDICVLLPVYQESILNFTENILRFHSIGMKSLKCMRTAKQTQD